MKEDPGYHSRIIQIAEQPIACDYMDVTVVEEGQPKFIIQPHLSGGAIAANPMALEVEGARALWRHLGSLLEEKAS